MPRPSLCEGDFPMQMPTIETRVATLEAVMTQINERLGNVEQGLRDLSTRMDSRFADMDNRLTNMDNRLTDMDSRNNSNFKWLVGLLVIVLLANVGTAISIIIALTKP